MNHSPATVLAQYLITSLLLGDPTASAPPTWPLYIGFMPDVKDVPNDSTAIFDTEGVKDGRIMPTGENVFHYGIQILFRSKLQADGWDKVDTIARALEILLNIPVTVGAHSYTVLNISQTSSPLFLGLERAPTRRYLHTVNFYVSIRQES